MDDSANELLCFLVWPFQRQQWVLLCNCLVGALPYSHYVMRSFPLRGVKVLHSALNMINSITILVTAKIYTEYISRWGRGGDTCQSRTVGGNGVSAQRETRRQDSQRPFIFSGDDEVIITDSQKAQQKVGKLVNRGNRVARTAFLGQLPETGHPLGPNGPLAGSGGSVRIC